ncbi:ComEA family DNA-binding protein [bacterium]|nr:MAG: ComEA family DNA-binding protein [bacterium]
MELIKIKKFIKKTTGLDRLLIAVVFIGALVSLVSIFRGILMDRKVEVEYLSGGSVVAGESVAKIFVDIEGAVISPGVYDLIDGSRVKDVLVMAGGLSESADRDFCEKNLNMAAPIKDGQKIYIPESLDTNAPSGYPKAANSSKMVSINSATVAELDTLWGIGPARADAIVKNRPYQSIDELVTKKVLTKAIVDRNREVLSVY